MKRQSTCQLFILLWSSAALSTEPFSIHHLFPKNLTKNLPVFSTLRHLKNTSLCRGNKCPKHSWAKSEDGMIHQLFRMPNVCVKATPSCSYLPLLKEAVSKNFALDATLKSNQHKQPLCFVVATQLFNQTESKIKEANFH